MSGFLDVLKAVAPTVATVLGGPLAGMAVSILGDVMGVSEPTQEKVSKMFESGKMGPEQIAQIKQAEIALVAKLKELDIDLERIHAQDRDSARKLQATTSSRIPGFLAILITVGFFGILVGMLLGELKASGNTEALLIMLGALGAAWGAVVNFYYGSSRGSEAKNEILARRAQ